METPEHEILMLVSAMIAQGRHFEREANIITMVKQAITARHQIYKSAKAELEALAAKEREEIKEREAANMARMLNEIDPPRPTA